MIAAQLNNIASGLLGAESVPNDGVGSTSLSPYWAPIEGSDHRWSRHA